MDSQTINGFVGPTFPDDASAVIDVQIQYLSLKKNKSRITSVINAGVDAANASGLLKRNLQVPDFVQAAMKNVETAIASTFDASVDSTNPLQLQFDAASSNALERSIRFNEAARTPGRLFVGMARLPTVITDLPLPGEPLEYGDGTYSAEIANGLLNKVVHGKTLRDYVAERMPLTFADLTTSSDAEKFKAASLAMKSIVESGDLALNASDQTAMEWAFLVNSPLLSDAEVRKTWILANSEARLKAYKLGLPPVKPRSLTAAESALVARAEAAISSANDSADLATAAYRDGTAAAQKTFQPGGSTGEGPRRLLNAQGVWEYRGEPAIASGQFSGVLRSKRWQGTKEEFTGEKYEGNLVLQGTLPVADGHGVRTFAKDDADTDLTSYTGEFRNGAMTGAGVLKWRNGQAFRGMVVNGQPTGAGLFEDADGGRYYGSYNGTDLDPATAVRIDADGQQIGGRWVANAFQAN
jgi:hypothetical protein